jgi:aminotransferase
VAALLIEKGAAIEALANGDDDIEMMREEYDSRRKLILEGVKSIGFTCFEPKGAFYVFPNISVTGKSSYEFCEGLILDQKVACVPGTAFGASGEGFIRCCYAASASDITKALERMKVYTDKIMKKG